MPISIWSRLRDWNEQGYVELERQGPMLERLFPRPQPKDWITPILVLLFGVFTQRALFIALGAILLLPKAIGLVRDAYHSRGTASDSPDYDTE